MEMTDFFGHFLIYQRACVLCAVVQLFGERAGHGASGEGVSDAAAAQHHQTQGGAVPRVRGLAGRKEGSSNNHLFLLVTGPWVMLQEDMRLVINQQVLQREEERKREKQEEREKTGGLQRSKSLKVKGEAGKGFFSFFKDK